MATTFDQVDLLQREFDGASERAAAIIAAAFLDDILREILAEFLIRDDAGDKDLFKGSGPLATFSSRIAMCFRLGLISAKERDTLRAVKNIRNGFAHVVGDISFQTQSIRDQCKNIEIAFSMVTPDLIPLSQGGKPAPLPELVKAPSDNPRAVFQEAVKTIMRALLARYFVASVERRISPPEFVAAHQPMEVIDCILTKRREEVEALRTERQALETKLEALRHKAGLVDSATKKPAQDPSVESRERKQQMVERLQRFAAQQTKAAHVAHAAKAAELSNPAPTA